MLIGARMTFRRMWGSKKQTRILFCSHVGMNRGSGLCVKYGYDNKVECEFEYRSQSKWNHSESHLLPQCPNPEGLSICWSGVGCWVLGLRRS